MVETSASGHKAFQNLAKVRIVDCIVHNNVPSIEVLYPYLTDHWRDYVIERGVTSLEPNYYPRGAPLSSRPGSESPSGDSPGSSLSTLRQQIQGGTRV